MLKLHILRLPGLSHVICADCKVACDVAAKLMSRASKGGHLCKPAGTEEAIATSLLPVPTRSIAGFIIFYKSRFDCLCCNADIGHFGKNPVRASFAFVAYPALMLTYLGQAAWMCSHIDLIPVTFFASIPFGDGFYWVYPFPPPFILSKWWRIFQQYNLTLCTLTSEGTTVSRRRKAGVVQGD